MCNSAQYPDDPEKKKHNGRRYDKQFKVAAAKLVTEQGYSPKQAALSLGVKISAQEPKEQAETLDTLRVRVKELEKLNRRLIMEKDVLKKATAFFAREQ